MWPKFTKKPIMSDSHHKLCVLSWSITTSLFNLLSLVGLLKHYAANMDPTFCFCFKLKTLQAGESVCWALILWQWTQMQCIMRLASAPWAPCCSCMRICEKTNKTWQWMKWHARPKKQAYIILEHLMYLTVHSRWHSNLSVNDYNLLMSAGCFNMAVLVLCTQCRSYTHLFIIFFLK